MRWSLPLLLVVCSFAFASQELSERQQTFMKELKKNVELQDLRAVNKLLQREFPIATDIVDLYCNAFARQGDVKILDEVKQLVIQMDEVEGGKRLQKRIAFLTPLKDSARQVWLDVCERARNASAAFEEARTKKDLEAWGKAAPLLEEVVKMASNLGDLEITSLYRNLLGQCHDGLSKYDLEVADFDKAIDEWVAAGRVKDDGYAYMVEKRRKLIEQGEDPAQKKDGGSDKAAPTSGKRSATNAYKEGSQFQEWAGEFKEMQAPDQLPSTSPFSIDYILLWREFGFRDKDSHPLGALSQASPFGKGLNVVRDGAHAFIRQGEDKKSDVAVKVLDNKPTLATIKDDAKDAERFSVFLTTGGQNGTWFSTSVNYQQSGRYRVGWYREAKVLGETIQILDDNCSGLLGDPINLKDNLLPDREGSDWVDNDGIIIGKKLMAWSDVVPIGGKWYHLQLGDTHGKQLRTRELDIETGQVVLKWNGPVPPRVLVIGEMRDFKGCYFDVAGGKPVTVPVGRYQIAYGELEAGKSAQAKQAWIFRGEVKPFDVTTNQLATLDMGGPYKLEVDRKVDAKSITIKGKSLIVKDKSGALVAHIYDEVLCPEVWTRPEGNGNGSAGKAMSRIDSKIFNKDNVAAWYPADYVLDKGKDQKVQVQLKLAKHSLLGGPFASDWK